MKSIVYVGLDIGGTLTKVSLASEVLNITPWTSIQLSNNSLNLHSRSFLNIQSCLTWLKESLIQFDIIRLGVTGGGAIKYNQKIKATFPAVEILKLNEYQSNLKGLLFIKATGLPVVLREFIKTDSNIVKYTSATITLNQCELPLQFISIGSGVNYHKFGLGQDGFERLKVEDPKTSYDGLLLDGTSLGGGYVFGVIRMLSQQAQPTKIFQLIKQDNKYSKIYEQLMINLMQTAITLSFVHHTPTIIANGSILKIKPLFEAFQKAMILSLAPFPFKRSLISLETLQGYLANVGILYSLLTESHLL